MSKYIAWGLLMAAQVSCAFHEGWLAAIFILGAVNMVTLRYLPDDDAKEVDHAR